MASTINASNSGSGGLISAGDASGVLALQTAGTTAITVDTLQNVGIGTTTPDIFSRGYTKTVGISSSGSTALQINSTGDYPAIELGRGGVRKFVLDAQSTICEIASLEAVPMAFSTNSTERMRIDSSGNLLVGCTSVPTAGGGGAAFAVDSNSRRALVLSTSTTSSNTLVTFCNPNGYVGNISVSGSSTAFNTSSDYRLKENIAPMTGALAKVALLKPVTYKWKVDGSDGEGFIAHELAEVKPDCVSGDKDAVDADGKPQYQGIDTSFLVATLTAAIQELKAINDTQAELISGQAATINAQSAALAVLTARIVALEGK